MYAIRSYYENKGKTTILFLSAIYCSWCQKAIPDIKKVYKKCSLNKDVDCIIFYPDDEQQILKEYIKEKGIDYPIAFIPTKSYKDVITSYSIHYTKLYDKSIHRVIKNEAVLI